MGRVKDLTGKVFGRLTVLRIDDEMSKIKKRTYWVCQCECGNIKVVRGTSLTNGKTISCGCYNSEKIKKLNEEQWKDEEFRQRKSEEMKKLSHELWQDEEFRQIQSEKIRKLNEEQWQDEEFKQIHWKGGITPISRYLRNLKVVKDWRKSTYIRENSKCQLTGKYVNTNNSNVHHLKGFNTIVREAHELHGIEIKEIIGDYTEEELQLLKNYITKWHQDTSNAVLLCNEVHNLFHRSKKEGGYGSHDNTPEQFEEFKERYLNGEFDKELDSKTEDVA